MKKRPLQFNSIWCSKSKQYYEISITGQIVEPLFYKQILWLFNTNIIKEQLPKHPLPAAMHDAMHDAMHYAMRASSFLIGVGLSSRCLWGAHVLCSELESFLHKHGIKIQMGLSKLPFTYIQNRNFWNKFGRLWHYTGVSKGIQILIRLQLIAKTIIIGIIIIIKLFSLIALTKENKVKPSRKKMFS